MEYNQELHKFRKIGAFLKYQLQTEKCNELFFHEFRDFKVYQGDRHFEIYTLIQKNSIDQEAYSELFTADFQFLFAFLEDDSDMILKCQVSEIANDVDQFGILFEVLDTFHKQRITFKP